MFKKRDKAPDAPVRMVRVRGDVVPVGSVVAGRSLPAGHAYAGGDGTRATLRRLRQMWARIEKAAKKNPLVQDGRERILDHAADDPNPEFTAMHLGAAALLAAEESGASLGGCLSQLADELDNRQEADSNGTTPRP